MVHMFWLLLIIANLIIQIRYFLAPSERLYLAKRITTPLMLFGAFLVIIISTNKFPLVESLILIAMGLGEIGIEGSQVVESKKGDETGHTSWLVTAAGVLFLLVNVGLGIVLLSRAQGFTARFVGIFVGIFGIAGMVMILGRTYSQNKNVLLQIRIYAVGLMILAAGTISVLLYDPGHLGYAAMILTISDGLVLWRMGAGWDRERPKEKKTLFLFLIVILLLYYSYMALLIDGTAPFIR